MNVIEYYHSLNRNPHFTDDFKLFPFKPGFNIGFDSDDNLCIVIESSNTTRAPLLQRTKLLSIECNRHLIYLIDGKREEKLVHIFRCFSTVETEKEIFLELICATMPEPASEEEVMEVFHTLSRFFSSKEEPSENELIGLYAELEVIWSFSPVFNLSDYWQSKDRMKFDFSFSDSLKLEVKATRKDFRTHHFRHEQLISDMYRIIVLSYMLRDDDAGVSLYDLIINVKPLFVNSPKKLLRIDSVLKNVSKDKLKELKFSPEYTKEKRHFYLASAIPKFEGETPDGVANAEYDCNLDNIPILQDDDFISIVKDELSKEA